jgi:hypothetical protein
MTSFLITELRSWQGVRSHSSGLINRLLIDLVSDGNIRYYEYESDSLFALAEHKSTDPQRGMCFLPRRALSVADCEIARAYKVYGSSIEPIAFIVPRKVRHPVHLLRTVIDH